jgi:small subunit ribosomal protein S20
MTSSGTIVFTSFLLTFDLSLSILAQFFQTVFGASWLAFTDISKISQFSKPKSMPQHKSNIKRMRTSAIARLRNRRDRSRCRSVEKYVLDARNQTDARAKLSEVFSVLDHMAAKGVLHANTVARRKSRLTNQVSKLPAA